MIGAQSKFHHCALPARQSGAVMLVFMLLIMTGAGFMLLNQINTIAIKNARDEHDARILAEAKQALIAYAVTFQETAGSAPPNPGLHGYLPCPDIDESGPIAEGGSHGTCGSRYVNSVGRYPWRSLGMQPLKDSSGECLWYAVSGQYKSSGTASPEMLNADTNGSFRVYGSNGTTVIAGDTPDDRPIAVIVAPGELVGSQNRADLATGTEICGGNYSAADYLDAEDMDNPASGIRNYVLNVDPDEIDELIITGNKENHQLNDKIITITREEIWSAIQVRNDFPEINDIGDVNDFYNMNDEYTSLDIDSATKWIAGCIAKYGNVSTYNRSLPYPAPIDIDSDVANGDYRDNASYIDLGSSYMIGPDYSVVYDVPLFGRLPDSIDISEDITDKGISNLITACDLTTNPPNGLNPPTASDQAKYMSIWENWKDHYFYAVADVFQPRSELVWQACLLGGIGQCECDNGARCISLETESGAYIDDYAAIVIFAGSANENDDRQSTPLDPQDNKRLLNNYIDDPGNIASLLDYKNTSLMTDKVNLLNYRPDPGLNRNDVIYCVNDNDTTAYFEVRRCPFSN